MSWNNHRGLLRLLFRPLLNCQHDLWPIQNSGLFCRICRKSPILAISDVWRNTDSAIDWWVWQCNPNSPFCLCGCLFTSLACHKWAIKHFCKYSWVSNTGGKACTGLLVLHPVSGLPEKMNFAPKSVEPGERWRKSVPQVRIDVLGLGRVEQEWGIS